MVCLYDKVHYMVGSTFSFFLVCFITWSVRLAVIMWTVSFKIPENFVRLILLDRFRIVQKLPVRMVKLKFSSTIPSRSPPPSQLCLVLYSFPANLLYSLIMWLIVSSLSPQNPRFLFWCVLSIFYFDNIGLYGVVLCCFKKRFYFSLKVFFLVHIQVFLCEISLACRLKCPFILSLLFFLRVFHASLSRWFLTGVWVTESLLMSPGPSSVFWPI